VRPVNPPQPHPAPPPVTAAGASDPDARTRLLNAAVRLFAHQGYANTSTRELAEAAQVNVAAISYYFGDKAGLYRAAFMEPMDVEADLARFTGAHLSLAEALAGFYAGFLEPLRQGDEARLCMKLHMRELLESSGLWKQGVSETIKPQHDALLALLARHFGLQEPDRELERLAICLAGLGVHLYVGLDTNEQLVPGINTAPGAIDLWAETLQRASLAMVQAEATRRGITLQGVSS
jgi:TetR/AcrR family transcriptional regulator, regulator of cefoperazone and chloramphenicol sensitivity